MRRILVLLTVAAMMAAVMLVVAPAWAAEGGDPTAGSCGFGTFSENLREGDFNYNKEKIEPSPGAGEASDLHPTECPGSD